MIWSCRCTDESKLSEWRSLGEIGPGNFTLPARYRNGKYTRSLSVQTLPCCPPKPTTCRNGVIGSRGASIDELLDDGVYGHLVELGDVEGLAETLVKVWKGESPVRKGFEWSSDIVVEMRPERAVANLLALAKNPGSQSGPVACLGLTPFNRP